jgi:tetratricopeptide (TPR) repeat protein
VPDPALPALRERALALHQQGDLSGAEAVYASILAIEPQNADVLHLSGVVALQRGDAAEAVARIEQAAACHPAPLYLANLGAALRRVGRMEDAVRALQNAIAGDPAIAEAHINLASAFGALGSWQDALAASDEALALRPDLPEGHLNRAAALIALGRAALAETAANQALACRPGWPDALLLLANAQLTQDRPDDAVRSYRAALAVRPDHLGALVNMGAALGRLGRMEEAAAVLRQAADLAPDQPEALLNLGGILRALGRLGEARLAQETILARDPCHWAAWSNLAAILHDLGCPDEAVAAWERSLALHPDQPDARYSRSLSLLLAGDFARGWEALEHRWQAVQHRGRARHRHLPLWNGEDLAGQTILLHAEEGLGDSIHFARYVPLVAARGARVVLETYKPLARLFQGLDGISHVITQGEPLPSADLQCPLQSLPRAFGTRLETIPSAVPYLRVPSEPANRWRAWLAGGGRRVGLVWAGSPTHGKDRERSIAFDRLAPLWRIPGVSWFSLQIGARATDAADSAVADLSQALTDLTETAAAICALDLVIAVDTSVAHLAGALGRPVWLVLPTTPDWRWMLGRDDSPWYPTMRLFRQMQPGNWEGVIARVAAELRAGALDGGRA